MLVSVSIHAEGNHRSLERLFAAFADAMTANWTPYPSVAYLYSTRCLVHNVTQGDAGHLEQRPHPAIGCDAEGRRERRLTR